MNNTDIFILLIFLHILGMGVYIFINGIMSKRTITYKKLFFEHVLVWIAGIIIFTVYIGLTFQHDFIIIDWNGSIIDIILLSICFIVIDYFVYFIGKKKYGKVFK